MRSYGGLGGGSPRFNYDGILYQPNGEDRYYTQLMRNGAVEVVIGDDMSPATETGTPTLAGKAWPSYVVEEVGNVFHLLSQTPSQPPFVVLFSLLRMKGVALVDANFLRSTIISRPSDRTTLLLPDVWVSESPKGAPGSNAQRKEIGSVLRPVFNTLWQTFGYPYCSSYTPEGGLGPAVGKLTPRRP